MCDICLQRLRVADDVQRLDTLNDTIGTEVVVRSTAPAEAEEIADFLTTGFWDSYGGPRKFDISVGDTLTYDISGLTTLGQIIALAALDTWSVVTGINFAEASGPAQIVFDDNNAGAYAFSSSIGGTIFQSTINVNASWLNPFSPLESYGFQTYLHEIGHALGLGHAGDYNGSATYSPGEDFAADSWQMSLMSYFSQDENPNTDADFAYALTPMQADIIAVRDLYGTAEVRVEDTTYGINGSDGGPLNDLFDFDSLAAMTIVDSDGTDRIDLTNLDSDQRLDLTPGAHSDVGDLVGNLTIDIETVIEEAVTGDGNDTIIGNTVDNLLITGGGDDLIQAGAGDDLIDLGSGNDLAIGDAGDDLIVLGTGNDQASGGDGNDIILGDGVSVPTPDELAWVHDLSASDGFQFL